MSTEMPKPNATETHVPAVEAEGGSREMVLAAHEQEKERREAFVREGGVIVEEPGTANQEADAAQRDRETAEAREADRRVHFFRDLIKQFPELTDVQRAAVQAMMEKEKTRPWSGYDGDDLKILRVVVAENLLTIVVDDASCFMTHHIKVAL